MLGEGKCPEQACKYLLENTDKGGFKDKMGQN